MTYLITHIQLSTTQPFLDTITNYFFAGQNGEQSQSIDKPSATTYVRNNPSAVFVTGGGSTAVVEVVENGGKPYLRTRGDGTTSDNLLSLPVIP